MCTQGESSSAVAGRRFSTTPVFTVDDKGNVSPTAEIFIPPGGEFFIDAPVDALGYAGYICLWQDGCRCSELVEECSAGDQHMEISCSAYHLTTKVTEGNYVLYAVVESDQGPIAEGMNGDVRIGSGSICVPDPCVAGSGNPQAA